MAAGATTVAGELAPLHKLYRDPEHRLLAGVAAGLAAHLGLKVVVVRIAFVALLVLDGLGALLYAAFWAVLPNPVTETRKPRRQVRQVLPFVALGVGVLLFQAQLGWFGINAALVVLLAMVATGAGVIWHQADPQSWRQVTSRLPDVPWLRQLRRTGEAEPAGERRWLVLRMVGGGILVAGGIIGILTVFAPFGERQWTATVTGMLFAALAITGMALALAPLLWRMVGQLKDERVARIREQERAEVAAMVHDQVLHTLALIQRGAADQTTVVRLARGQERALRKWLYTPTGSPSERFAAALEQIAAEVEDTYGVSVETVVVGDAETGEQVAAVVAAAREALVNAARHAKVTTVSLYAEVEDEQFSVYVRDRGAGFDMASVDDDRHGVRGSIVGRMQRHGGRADIRSNLGEGTEVALVMPRPKEATRARDSRDLREPKGDRS